MRMLTYFVFIYSISFAIPVQAKDARWKIFVDIVTGVAGSAIYDLVKTSTDTASEADASTKISQIGELEAGLEQFRGTGIPTEEIQEISELLGKLRTVVQETEKLPADLGARMTALENRVSILESTTASINQLIQQRGVDVDQTRLVEPSFDCGKAQAPIEVSICSSTELSYIDGEMGDLYWDLRGGLNSVQSSALRNDQLAWLNTRDISCGAYDQPCLLGVYRERISQLKRWTEN